MPNDDVRSQSDPNNASQAIPLTKKQRRELRRAEHQAHGETQTSKMRRDKAVMALVVTLALIGVAALLVYLKRPVDVSDVDTSLDPVRGATNPQVVIQEYGDFQCGACKQAEPVLKKILETYPNDVQLVFKDFPLRGTHLLAQAASEAALCANTQNKFWEYHDALYDQQTSWVSLSPNDFQDFLKTLATQVSVSDTAAFDTCVDKRETRASVDADVAIGESLRVQSTPTFFVNGERVVGAVPFEEFKKIIEKKLAESPQDTPANVNTNQPNASFVNNSAL